MIEHRSPSRVLYEYWSRPKSLLKNFDLEVGQISREVSVLLAASSCLIQSAARDMNQILADWLQRLRTRLTTLPSQSFPQELRPKRTMTPTNWGDSNISTNRRRGPLRLVDKVLASSWRAVVRPRDRNNMLPHVSTPHAGNEQVPWFYELDSRASPDSRPASLLIDTVTCTVKPSFHFSAPINNTPLIRLVCRIRLTL